MLRLRTTSDSVAGSLDPHPVRVGSDAWDEATLTWANRPDVGTTVLGTLTGGTAVNRTFDTALDPAGLAGLLGAPATLTISSTGTDSLYVWSRNTATVANRPLLSLTFTPVVLDTTAPTVPQDLAATRPDDATVALTWAASSDEKGVTGYDVYRSTAAGTAPSAATLLTTTATTSTVDASPLEGQAWYSVVAKDAAGNRSAPSAEVLVDRSVPRPDTTAPSAPLDPVAQVDGRTATVSWTAATDDRGVTAYEVFRTATSDASLAGVTPVGTTTSTAFVETGLPDGAWSYRVVALDAAGNRSAPSAPATASVDSAAPSAPPGVTAQLSGRTATITWQAATDDTAVTGYEVYRTPTPDASLDGATPVATTSGLSAVDPAVPDGSSSYRVVALDRVGHRSAPSAAATVTVDATPPPAPGDVVATVSGRSVTVTWTPPSDPSGIAGYDVYRVASPSDSLDGRSPVASTTTATATEADVPDGTWSYRVVATDGVGNRSFPSAAATVTVDNQAPSAPTDVTGTVFELSVSLSWTASQDPSGIAGYDVHRTAAKDAPLGASTKVGSAAGTTIEGLPTPAGTWYFSVVPRDAAGNVGPAGASPAVTVSTPTTVTVQPVADTYGNAGAPSTSFGTSTSLTSRGTPGAVSYLRFTLPAAPDGKRLTSAVLQLRTSTDSSAGSLSAHVVRLGPDDSWSESTMTWRNRPASEGPQLGSLPAGSVPSAWYDVPLSAGGLSALVGSTGTLTISGADAASGDGVIVWSSNASSSLRPRLVLKYS